MEGVSEGSFVQVLSAAKLVRAWFTPFIRISNGVPRLSKLRTHVQPYLDTGLPVIAQIMGTRTEILAEVAARLHTLGVICVDLNCGCPSQTVLSSHSGGWHLQEPLWIRDTLLAMRKACGKHAISVKIRCGFESVLEMPAIADAINEVQPDLVTSHFRTVREMYRPIPDGLERLAKMRQLMPSLPLIGSGDLFTVEDAVRMQECTGVDGVAPARGLMTNPALLRLIESACGGEPFMALTDDESRLAFLRRLGEVSGRSPRHQGFVLKLAKYMFGESSHQFASLRLEGIGGSPKNTNIQE